MTYSSPRRLERSIRPVPRRAFGWIFYGAAAAFALGTAGIVALWVVKAARVSRLEADVDDAVGKKDFDRAVRAARTLKTDAFRWERPAWQRREGRLLLDWARHLLEDKRYAEALEKADAAEQAGKKAGLEDQDFLDGVRGVSGEAALGMLDKEWPQLDRKTQITRLERIASQYKGAVAGTTATDRLAQCRKAADEYAKRRADLLARAAALRDGGLVQSAVERLQAFRATCDREDQAALDKRLAELKALLAKGHYKLDPVTPLAAGAPLASARVRILRPGRQFIALVAAGRPARAAPDAPTPRTRPASRRPASAAGGVCLTCQQGVLYAMSTDSGKLLWGVHQGLGMEFAGVRAGGDFLCVADWGRTLSRLNGRTGRPVWSVALPSPPVCQPVGVKGGVAVLDQAGCLRIVSSATGRPLAEYRPASAGGAGASGAAPAGGRSAGALLTGTLQSDGRLHLAVLAGPRAVLFEGGQNRWYRIAVVLRNPPQAEAVWLMDRRLCLLPRAAARGGRSSRLFLWRDREITPLGSPDVPPSWRMVDQCGELQLWLDAAGAAACTFVDNRRLDERIRKLSEFGAPGALDGRLIVYSSSREAIVTGDAVQVVALPAAATPSPTTEPAAAAPPRRREIAWPAERGARPVTALRILHARDDALVVTGTSDGAAVFARLAAGDTGEGTWLWRLGPNAAGPPAVSDDLAVWSDGHAGLWTLDAAGKLRHRTPQWPAEETLHVAGGRGGRVLLYSRRHLMLYDGKLQPAWAKAAAAPDPGGEGIASACLYDDAVVVLSDSGGVSALAAATGAPAPVPGGLADRLSAAAPRIKRIRSGAAGLWVHTDAGWRLLPDGPAPLDADLTRLLYEDQTVALLAGDGDGALACFELPGGRQRWCLGTAEQGAAKGSATQPASRPAGSATRAAATRAAASRAATAPRPAPAGPYVWAAPAAKDKFWVLTQAGELLSVGAAAGEVRAARSLGGVPTAPPAPFRGALWVVLSGYRLVKLAPPQSG